MSKPDALFDREIEQLRLALFEAWSTAEDGTQDVGIAARWFERTAMLLPEGHPMKFRRTRSSAPRFAGVPLMTCPDLHSAESDDSADQA